MDSKFCEYCQIKEKRIDIINNAIKGIRVSLFDEEIEGENIFIGIRNENYDGDILYQEYEKINFCPMCGREL